MPMLNSFSCAVSSQVRLTYRSFKKKLVLMLMVVKMGMVLLRKGGITILMVLQLSQLLGMQVSEFIF